MRIIFGRLCNVVAVVVVVELLSWHWCYRSGLLKVPLRVHFGRLGVEDRYLCKNRT